MPQDPIKKSEANWPVKKSVRVRREAIAPTAREWEVSERIVVSSEEFDEFVDLLEREPEDNSPLFQRLAQRRSFERRAE